MQLKSEIPKQEMDDLRKGFDFIIDIDAKAKLKHAQVAAIKVYEFLQSFGITPTVKFSGSRGFHLAVSGNAFPSKIDFKDISQKYPDVPQTIANFIRERIRDELLEDFTFKGGLKEDCQEFIKDFDRPVALHIRRSDYAQYSHHPIQSLTYYAEALEYFDDDRTVFIFSDDPDWCKDQKLFEDDRFMISSNTVSPILKRCGSSSPCRFGAGEVRISSIMVMNPSIRRCFKNAESRVY